MTLARTLIKESFHIHIAAIKLLVFENQKTFQKNHQAQVDADAEYSHLHPTYCESGQQQHADHLPLYELQSNH